MCLLEYTEFLKFISRVFIPFHEQNVQKLCSESISFYKDTFNYKQNKNKKHLAKQEMLVQVVFYF